MVSAKKSVSARLSITSALLKGMNMEMELKLMVSPASQAAVLQALELADVTPVPFRAHYFDTADGRLAARGVSVRLRREGKAWVQTVKATGDSRVRRFEDNVPLKAAARRPGLDLSRHAGADGACKALAKALKGAALPLIESYSTEISRRARLISSADHAIEIAFDKGQVQAHGREAPVSEVELELTAGDNVAPLFALARALVAEHHLWLSTLAKSTRGEALARPDRAPLVQHAGRITADPDADGDAQLRAMVAHCLDQILPNASHVAAGSTDADQIHQLRVGIRRLRTVLRELSGLSTDVAPAWEEQLAKAFRDLGAFRDQDAVQEAVAARLASAGAPALNSSAEGAPPPPAPDVTVRDQGFQLVLLDLLEFSLGQATTAGKPSPKATLQLVKKRLQKLHARVVADGKQFTQLPAEQQHQVRKRLKRLRYVSEFAGPMFGKASVERYLHRLRPAQDALGEHNDDAVALEGFRLRAEAGNDGPVWFAVGWLTSRQEQTAKQCRKALRRIDAVEPFWR
jgi:inorganic triphosphatase YgiF